MERFGFKSEPIAWITLILAVLLTSYRVFGPDQMSLAEVFTEDYVEGVMLLASALIARMSVFAPANVRDADEDPTP